MKAATSARLTVYHTQTDEFDNPVKTNSEGFYTTLESGMNSETAQTVINWAQGFVGITKDTYEYTKIEESVSITEILQDQE